MEGLNTEQKSKNLEKNGSYTPESLTFEQAEKLELRLREESQPLYEMIIEHPAVVEALMLLDRLPEHLTYHAKEHTLDVIRETVLFAYAGGANHDVIEQQAVSAAWHDVGFIQRDKENENISIKFFEQSESYKTFPQEFREEVIRNIRDTEVITQEGIPFLLKQHSTYGYVLDGDASNLGRKDLFEKRILVAEELKLDLNNAEVRRRFYRFTINLLKNYEWKTTVARQLRQPQQLKNLEQAEREWSELNN